MKRLLVPVLATIVVATCAGLLLWPRAKANAQINAEGCTCSRPATAGSGRDQISLYYCTCPAMQCVVTATAAGASVPPNLVQSCASR